MEIVQAKITEKDEIINFIKKNWKENHIFVLDEDLFDFYYKENKYYNMLLAKEEGKIKAILGYIKYSKNSKNIFLSLWKSIDNSMLGLICLEKLKEFYKIHSCGINKKTIPIYKFLEIKTGRLKHFYKLNPQVREYKIAKISQLEESKSKKYTFYEKEKLEILTNTITNEIYDSISKDENIFFKSYEYFKKIYLNNLYYKYIVLGLKSENLEIKTIVVLREIEINSKKCIRIIDIIGKEELLPILNNYIEEKFIDEMYEYIDLYEIGLNEKVLETMGFLERKENDLNIIPNYFEPFEQKNIEIYYASSADKSYRIFKGDGDQDRPSVLKSKEKKIEK